MLHDENKYISNQTCEFCNEPFRMFEKIIFPKECVNRARADQSEIVKDTNDEQKFAAAIDRYSDP